jgi:predicted dithiol-disulfide oxidoreductase (DUF899 family)
LSCDAVEHLQAAIHFLQKHRSRQSITPFTILMQEAQSSGLGLGDWLAGLAQLRVVGEFEEWEQKLNQQEQRVREETQKLLAMHRDHPGRKIQDYTLRMAQGLRQLSTFFGAKNELLLVHNMGKKCSHCTLWADGLVGFTAHLQDRAAFLLVNGDEIKIQTEMAKSRGWNFPMASTQETTLFQDLGFHASAGGDEAGVSVILRDADGVLWQKTKADFGPGDLFCSLWNFIGLLPSHQEWSPKNQY